MEHARIIGRGLWPQTEGNALQSMRLSKSMGKVSKKTDSKINIANEEWESGKETVFARKWGRLNVESSGRINHLFPGWQKTDRTPQRTKGPLTQMGDKDACAYVDLF